MFVLLTYLGSLKPLWRPGHSDPQQRLLLAAFVGMNHDLECCGDKDVLPS